MSRKSTLDKRIEEQNKKKREPILDEEPDDMELEMDRVRQLPLNKQKSIFDTDGGNNTPGINTEPSIFEKTAVFHIDTEKKNYY